MNLKSSFPAAENPQQGFKRQNTAPLWCREETITALAKNTDLNTASGGGHFARRADVLVTDFINARRHHMLKCADRQIHEPEKAVCLSAAQV